MGEFQNQITKEFTISGTTETPAGADLQTMVFDLRQLNPDGNIWIKVEATTVTAGLAAVDIELRAAIVKHDGKTWAESQAAQAMVKENVTLAVNTPKLYQLDRFVFDHGDYEKCLGPDGFYIYLTGVGGDNGVVQVTALVR